MYLAEGEATGSVRWTHQLHPTPCRRHLQYGMVLFSFNVRESACFDCLLFTSLNYSCRKRIDRNVIVTFYRTAERLEAFISQIPLEICYRESVKGKWRCCINYGKT